MKQNSALFIKNTILIFGENGKVIFFSYFYFFHYYNFITCHLKTKLISRVISTKIHFNNNFLTNCLYKFCPAVMYIY